MPTVETSRLQLRRLRPADLGDLYSLLSDPDVVKYVGAGKTATLAETETALISFGKHWERHGFGRWAVIEKDTQKLIGYGGLRILVDTPEVVYHFMKPYWGFGLATEMARASLRYGFEEHRFERIIAIAMPENRASIHVMEKIGMVYEKRANYYGFDVVQYSISRENYRPDDSFYILRRD
jgi:ribosomal-protein-alanine N-acetyltransferase